MKAPEALEKAYFETMIFHTPEAKEQAVFVENHLFSVQQFDLSRKRLPGAGTKLLLYFKNPFASGLEVA